MDQLIEEDVYFGEWRRKYAKVSISKNFTDPIDDEIIDWSIRKMAIMYDFLKPKINEIIMDS